MATVIKNIPFVGGSVQTFEFDFGTKVSGSVAECPMNVYWSIMSSIQTPGSILPDVNGNELKGFRLVGSNSIYGWEQDYYNAVKIPDGSYRPTPVTTAGGIAQLVIELDLTPLCTALFGGSNSAMKAAMLSFIADVYAKGSGPSGAGVTLWSWAAGGNQWAQGTSSYASVSTNSTSNITHMTWGTNNNGDSVWFTSNSNKIYFMLKAEASNGTIASEVDLDYVKITLQFARVTDSIAPIPITLPSTWSILVKGFSPAWNNIPINTGKAILMLKKDSNNFIGLDFENPTKVNFFKVLNLTYVSSEWVYSNSQSFSNFQIINLLIEQTSAGMRLRILKNQGNVEKYTNTNIKDFTGSLSLLLGQDFRTSNNNADAFINSVIFLPDKNFDDDIEAESVLRGLESGYENDELFDITKVSLNTNATLQGNVISLNATAAWQGSEIYIPILPNNQYTLSFTKTGTGGEAWVDEYYNSIEIKQNLVAALGGGQANGTYTATFVTGPRTNKIHIAFDNGQTTSGAYTFSDISLKLKM